MYLLGMFVSQQFQTAGAADLADLDFFPFPNLGTQFDAEKALDAPIDGFMISSKSPTLAADLTAAKAFMEYMGQPATQVAWVTKDPGNIAAAKDADTAAYNALQKKAAELIGAAQKITQFLDRDTNPNFAGPNGMQAFLLDFLKNPDPGSRRDARQRSRSSGTRCRRPDPTIRSPTSPRLDVAAMADDVRDMRTPARPVLPTGAAGVALPGGNGSGSACSRVGTNSS